MAIIFPSTDFSFSMTTTHLFIAWNH